jgi:hypothetical protein
MRALEESILGMFVETNRAYRDTLACVEKAVHFDVLMEARKLGVGINELMDLYIAKMKEREG